MTARERAIKEEIKQLEQRKMVYDIDNEYGIYDSYIQDIEIEITALNLELVQLKVGKKLG